MARANGLCDQWYREWKDDDSLDDCIDRFIRGFDFVRENDFPPLDFCRQHFANRKELLHWNHVFLDDTCRIHDVDNGFYVFLGNCKADMFITGFKAVTIYCRNYSEVNVYAKEGARVFVRYYDSSIGVCKSDEMSKIRRYDNNA